MKLISWNVNGLRACVGKGFFDFFAAQDADIFCLGETKMQPDQAHIPTEGYLRATISTGITRRKKDIPALLSLQKRSRWPFPMVWASTSTTTRAV